MFKIKGHKAILKGMHQVSANKLVLFADDDHDVLYTGSNIYGNRLLCSIVAEDDENEFVRYIHALITDEQYYAFLNKQVSLLKLITDVDHFFLVDFNYEGKETNHAVVSVGEIPPEYRPNRKSFCPDFIFEPSFNYAASLKGKEADLHKALPDDLNVINTSFSQFLEIATGFMDELKLKRTVYVEALKAGSFQINFKIELHNQTQTSLFEVSTGNVKSFLKDFTTYILNQLPKEDTNALKGETISSKPFKKLERELTKLFNDNNVVLPENGLEQKLLDLITYSVNPLKDITYHQSFDKIEFTNLLDDGNVMPIALVDDNYIPLIEQRVWKSEQEEKPDVETVDDFPKDYTIQVYQFNKESGKGSAYYDEDDAIIKVGVHALGKKDYAHTPLTKSLDNGKKVEISGYGKRINGKLTLITIRY